MTCWRMRRARVLPRAVRIAVSLRRVRPRATRRFAMLRQAISNRQPVAARRV